MFCTWLRFHLDFRWLVQSMLAWIVRLALVLYTFYFNEHCFSSINGESFNSFLHTFFNVFAFIYLLVILPVTSFAWLSYGRSSYLILKPLENLVYLLGVAIVPISSSILFFR